MTLECPRCAEQMDLVETLGWPANPTISTNTYYCGMCDIYVRRDESIDEKPPPKIFIPTLTTCPNCHKPMHCVASEPEHCKPWAIKNYYFEYCYQCEAIVVTRRTREEWIITHYVEARQEKEKVYGEAKTEKT